MGVRVIEADSASDSYDDEECGNCHKTATKTKTSNTKRTTQSTPDASIYLSKDLVGNCKEYRIENNTKDLRIIGNSNKIRIIHNSGNLQIIGNATRLKIQQNTGTLRYTGNDGRIYLGRESPQQSVDYIGCNGLLKVVKSLDLQGSKRSSKRKTEPKETKSMPSQSRSVEIDQSLTIVNGVGGNIVIKNAINVSM